MENRIKDGNQTNSPESSSMSSQKLFLVQLANNIEMGQP